ncbi:MAG: 50S ribosomal protein L11 methyltransferase, partial [Clostridiales bacterium]|nr:50S ribosomal protein L11 methyltransferase [Candidatus Coliplasma equi]
TDAVDIDMVAARIAEENALNNGLPKNSIDVVCGNVLDDIDLWNKYSNEKYGVILANIVADIINDMLPMFHSSLKDCGRMICSGIISPRKDFVLEALENNGFTVEKIREKNEWVAIVCRKK